MAGETPITVIGNITADPELRFTANGAAVANFTIASTPKKFNKQTQQFEDGETLFMRCSAWRDMAENVAESLSRGTRVVAQGNLTSRSFQTKEGENRTVMELDVQEVGPSLRYASAVVTKNERGQGGGQSGFQQSQQGGFQQGYPQQGQQQAPQQGSWGSGGDWGAPQQSSAPF